MYCNLVVWPVIVVGLQIKNTFFFFSYIYILQYVFIFMYPNIYKDRTYK